MSETFAEKARRRLIEEGLATPKPETQAPMEFDADLIPDVGTSSYQPRQEDLDIDAILAGIDVVDAYEKWCGKSVPKRTKSGESIMISCPNPDHPDKNPSAWMNSDKGVYSCGGCSFSGGDKYDIAAWHFGYPVPNYKTDGSFPKLRRDMAESMGHAISRDVGEGAPRAVATSGAGLVDESLQPVDLAAVLNGSVAQPIPSMLQREDGKALFYEGAVNGIHGASGAGKGWVICQLIADNALSSRSTMLLDFEDTAISIVARLRSLGMSDQQISSNLVYIRPQVPFDTTAIDHLVTMVVTSSISAVVIDSIGEAFALEGINEDKDVEVGPWYRRVPRLLAETGAAVVIVDHATKAADNWLYPSGSKRKRAAVTGASYVADAKTPFVKGEGGRLRLTCAKDRHGNFRQGAPVGDLVMESSGSTVSLRLYPPGPSAGPITVVTIAKAAVAAAKSVGVTTSLNKLEPLMAVTASHDRKRDGIEYAVAVGSLREEAGARNARLFTYVKDLPL